MAAWITPRSTSSITLHGFPPNSNAERNTLLSKTTLIMLGLLIAVSPLGSCYVDSRQYVGFRVDAHFVR